MPLFEINIPICVSSLYPSLSLAFCMYIYLSFFPSYSVSFLYLFLFLSVSILLSLFFLSLSASNALHLTLCPFVLSLSMPCPFSPQLCFSLSISLVFPVLPSLPQSFSHFFTSRGDKKLTMVYVYLTNHFV
jgi:hypothetical protein